MEPVIRRHAGAAFGSEKIQVEFLVLHYTACTLERTLELFCGPEAKTCAHFVIDFDGSIHELGDFWVGPILQGAHAGKSVFELEGKTWEAFNRFSIGVEIVNFNGNLVDYTAAQYEALGTLVRTLQSRFPALRDPARVVGHEQIAGFRGKADPGIRFDWKRFFSESYPGQTAPVREAILTQERLSRFEAVSGKIEPARMKAADWSELSSRLEAFLASEQ
jgi:N-acetyl-anhydromuramyl-L-alanine amidase AmpD